MPVQNIRDNGSIKGLLDLDDQVTVGNSYQQTVTIRDYLTTTSQYDINKSPSDRLTLLLQRAPQLPISPQTQNFVNEQMQLWKANHSFPPRTISHERLFPKKMRLQGAIGACQTFSAIALLQAIIFRDTGSKVELSAKDLFLKLYMSSVFPDWDGNSEIPTRDDFRDALISESRYSRTAEGASYMEAFKKGLSGICFAKTRPIDNGFSRQVQQLRTRVERMFYFIRYNAKFASIESTVVRLKEELSKILERDGVFDKFYSQHGRPSNQVLSERHKVEEMLKSYTIAHIEMIYETPAEKKDIVIAALQHGPIGGSITGLPGHAIVITEYFPSRDEFTVRDPARGKITVKSRDLCTKLFMDIFYLKKR